MIDQTEDSFTRSAAHRRALLTLGLGGIGGALIAAPVAAAKSGSGKKRKQRCKRQRLACIDQMRIYCATQGNNAPFCEEDLLPCCETCNVGAGIICVVESYTTLG